MGCYPVLFLIAIIGLCKAIPIQEPPEVISEDLPHPSLEESNIDLWQPPDGVTREDWLRCQGMPCDQYERTQDKLRQVLQMDFQLHLGQMGDGVSWDLNDIAPINGTIDGCVYLTEEQVDAMLIDVMEEMSSVSETEAMGSVSETKKRRKRAFTNFRNNPFLLWPITEPVLYKFDGVHNYVERTTIQNAFQQWQDNTCLRFQEVPMNAVVNKPHILLAAYETGCHSYVGRVPFFPQLINLKYNCLWEFGIPLHEIGHALGLWHEQQRPDRDDYIQINWENLGSYISQFRQRNDILTLGKPYDYHSVMHYAATDGTSNGLPTMETLDPQFQSSIGQRVGLSWNDVKIINDAYCNDVCPVPLPSPCLRNGYQDPNDCSRCKCPDGFTGEFCERLAPEVGDTCGGTLYASTQEVQELTSPGYYTSGHYNNWQQCNWLIQAPTDHRVVMWFEDDFGVYCHHQQECFHWLEIQYKDVIGKSGPRFCCFSKPKNTLYSDAQEVALIFRTYYNAWNYQGRRGFKVKFVADLMPGIRDEDATVSSTVLPSSTTTLSTTTSPQDNWRWTCDFENIDGDIWCGITQEQDSDNFDWTRQTGTTPSDETGPVEAYSGIHYIYIEASRPRLPNDKAAFYLPRFERSGVHCLQFAYNMFGFHIRSLVLFIKDVETQRTIWRRDGQQGDRWFTVDVPVDLRTNEQLGFLAVRGDEFSGDVAIDRLILTSGNC